MYFQTGIDITYTFCCSNKNISIFIFGKNTNGRRRQPFSISQMCTFIPIYYNNTIVPICSAIADEFKRKFLSKTAISQRQTIFFYRDPFKLVPVSQLADIADKFRRNEIMTSNELRAEIGMKPSDAANAETLRNPNLNEAKNEIENTEKTGVDDEEEFKKGGKPDA
jgi:hypothetical protein